MHVYSGIPADLDKDGDQDIIIAANESDKIIWWENNFISTDIQENNLISENTLTVFPNPFSAETTITFNLKSETHTKLIICDLKGEIIATLVDKKLSAGKQTFNFNAENFDAGIYFCKLITYEKKYINKMIIIK